MIDDTDNQDPSVREPTEEEIKAFLQQGQSRMESSPLDEAPELPPVELPPELAAKIEREKMLRQEKEMPVEREMEPSADIFNNDVSEYRVASEVWSSTIQDTDRELKVGVSEQERETYFKTMLSDSRFVIPVQVNMGGITLDIHIGELLESTKVAIGHALNVMAKGDNPTIYDVSSWASWYQYMMVASSVLRIGDFQTQDIEAKLREAPGKAVQILEAAAREGPLAWREARWFAVRQAWRVFQEKTRICREAWRNGDFPEPPDTGS